MVVISVLILTTILLAQPHPAWTTCQQLYFNANHNVRANAALDKHTFTRLNVSSVFDCFTECHKHCRCQSFNYYDTYWSAGICELNDADAYDDKVSIIVKNGWLFYNLDRQLPVNCGKSYSRCCSTSKPCENNGACVATCEPLGRRYYCVCVWGTTGERCQIKTNDR